jgi:hypothetical protein
MSAQERLDRSEVAGSVDRVEEVGAHRVELEAVLLVSPKRSRNRVMRPELGSLRRSVQPPERALRVT